MGANNNVKRHICHQGEEELKQPHALEVVQIEKLGKITGHLTLTAMNAMGTGSPLTIGIEINACPLCLVPLTTFGKTLGRQNNIDGRYK